MTETTPPKALGKKSNRWQRSAKWGKRLLVYGLLLLLSIMVFTRWVSGQPNAVARVESIREPTESTPCEELVVMSVNCAHGRGDGAHQALTSKTTLRKNCEAIGSLLAKRHADIVCMQECDAPSWWSGNFDHAKLIAESADISQRVHALNVNGAGLQYGAALLSRLQLSEAVTHTFRPTPPTFSKGVAIARMRWPGDESFEFDVVAVHLDFASGSARKRQAGELIEILRERGKPVIIAGDLNCNWRPQNAVCQLASGLDLTAYEPESEMVTFPLTGERLDWILVSREFRITSVEAIDSQLSDHHPLQATIRRVQ